MMNLYLTKNHLAMDVATLARIIATRTDTIAVQFVDSFAVRVIEATEDAAVIVPAFIIRAIEKEVTFCTKRK